MLEKLQNGAKAVGQKQTLRAIKDDRAEAVFIAADAAEKVTAPVKEICAQKGLDFTEVPTMKELGAACGIQIGAAAAVLLK